ncbi:MAG: dephospho-CoA kinase, partial [Acidovorax sp.]|nr:dephospho-CoA kinase [Acidovorax sp.]
MPHTLPLPVRAPIGPLGRRLLVLFIAVLALSLVGSAIGLWSLLRIGQSTDDMVQRSVTNERLVADAYRLQAINAERYKAVALSSEPEVGETLGADIAETQRQYDALIDTHGALDRAGMRALVFAHPAAREQLEAIVHPLVGQQTA